MYLAATRIRLGHWIQMVADWQFGTLTLQTRQQTTGKKKSISAAHVNQLP